MLICSLQSRPRLEDKVTNHNYHIVAGPSEPGWDWFKSRKIKNKKNNKIADLSNTQTRNNSVIE